jgi:hypothetical protein
MLAERKTPLVTILAAWLAVSIPAAWGIWNTVRNAAKLSQHPNSSSAVPSPAVKGK